jgi:hypothetical protein
VREQGNEFAQHRLPGVKRRGAFAFGVRLFIAAFPVFFSLFLCRAGQSRAKGESGDE